MKKILLIVVATIMSCASVWAQWNSNNAVNLLAWPDDGYYSSDMKVAPDGKVWLALHTPFHNAETDKHGVTVSLQLIDEFGVFQFEEPIVVSDYESRSWVSFGDYLYVDRDGNAIVALYDWRMGVEYYEGYTVYKISPEGEFLWGDEGITLEGENVYDLVANMSMCQIADGSYVFAWVRTREENLNMMSIEMQRISPEGEMLWNPEDVRLYDEAIPYSYPYLVDGGNNQVILIYAKGSGQDIMARKLDFDGTPVWSKDTKVYNCGWGTVPIWTILQVHPVDGGGFMVSWYDDRNYTEIESSYMAYILSNGDIGFSIENGQILGISDFRALHVKSTYDKATDSFYAIWNETSSGQSWNSLVAQRISKDGELLWGETGVVLEPMEQTNYGYHNVTPGINDEAAFFYMRSYTNNYGGDVEAFVTTVNANDTTLRRKSAFTKGDRVSEKAGLKVTPMINDTYWVAKWTDNGTIDELREGVAEDRLMMQRINNDFSLGSAGVETIRTESANFEALATLVENEAMFATNMSAATQATLAIYDINGALVATPFDGVLAAGRQYIEWGANVPAGIYLATLTTANGVETVKLLVK
ncbi:MAG: T9SS type A sorting domain-containing protein [Bacteroidales bacterium]|nr:T9SS type A sorting domain-containing protein [Bacteroidales bacterium]